MWYCDLVEISEMYQTKGTNRTQHLTAASGSHQPQMTRYVGLAESSSPFPCAYQKKAINTFVCRVLLLRSGGRPVAFVHPIKESNTRTSLPHAGWFGLPVWPPLPKFFRPNRQNNGSAAGRGHVGNRYELVQTEHAWARPRCGSEHLRYPGYEISMNHAQRPSRKNTTFRHSVFLSLENSLQVHYCNTLPRR
jgi:hypothetical protein